MKPRKIAFVCGGTGGHVYPAIAMAQQENKDEVLFFVSKTRVDRDIVRRYGFAHKVLGVASRYKLFLIQNFFEALINLKAQKITHLVAMGGYFTAPVILAAKLWGIPIYLHEQNVFPGRVTMLFKGFAKKIFLSFKASKTYINGPNVEVTGNPVRQQYLEDEAYKQLQALKLNPQETVLAFGGSQAADFITDLLLKNKAFFEKENKTLILITGPKRFKVLAAEYQQADDQKMILIKDTTQRPYLILLSYFEHMAFLYSQVSHVICRAGATSIAELLHYQKPGFLIPYPFSKDDHQVENAKVFCELGVGGWHAQDTLNFERLSAFLEQKYIYEKTTKLIKKVNFN